MKRISTKLMIIMVITAVVIVTILSIVSISAVNNTTANALRRSAVPLSDQAAKNFDMTISQYETDLAQAAKSDPFRNASTPEQMASVIDQEFPETAQDQVFFSILGTDGSLLYEGGPAVSSVIGEEDIKMAMSSSDPVITGLVVYKDTVYGEKIFFSILQQVKLSDRTVIACATINSDLVDDVFKEGTAGKNGHGYLLNSEGQVLLHSDMSYAYSFFNPIKSGGKEYKELSAEVRKMLSGESGSGSYELDGKKYIYGYSTTGYFNAKLVFAMAVEDFSDSSADAMRNILILGAVILVLTIIVSLIFARRISKPITSATKRIRLLAQGNLSAPVDVWYSKDELGVLTNSLEETIVCLRQYINLITVALTQISEGNLCHRMEGTFKGDFQQIKNTFNEILNSLSDTFASINTAAEQVNSGAVQVSNSAQAVSQGSTQQASAIEELSVTLRDVSKQVEQNSEDAKNAYGIVSKNTDAVQNCNDDMEHMLEAINAIHTSSAEISKIIKVIDEIAFQTNILALNAAVEAAREGSKGFGVVADEVRRLASRSAEAAKQTAELIEKSYSAVSEGNDIAQKTAASLHEIVDGSEEIQNLVKNISDASETQTVAIAQINTGLDQISDVVSANTSSSVGTASASEELSSQSLILKNMIARFKLDAGDTERKTSSRFEYVSDDDVFPEEPDEPADTEFGGFTDEDDDKY